MVVDVHISWAEYDRKIEQLAVQIAESDWQFEQILCLARGGLRVGDILSRIFRKPLAILSVSSYSIARERGSLKFSNNISMTTATLNQPLLLLDDLVDTGETLKQTIDWLQQHHHILNSQVRSGVIWYKASSIYQPDFYIDYLPDNPWIHQPFEVYESITLAQLQNKCKAFVSDRCQTKNST
jgi:uncharacterized protein